MTETIVWLGRGVYIRAHGTWYHEATCPMRTTDDYERRFFPVVPPERITVIDGMDDVLRSISGMRLSLASSYSDLTEREALILVNACQRWNIPYDLQSETRKRRWKKPITTYFFAAPLNELCK